MRILLIEDDELLGNTLTEQLRPYFVVDFVTSGKQALYSLSDGEYDLIILDLALPDMNGEEVCRTARERNITTPVLILTGQDNPEQKVSLFEAGADDYLTKPFHFPELQARLRALLRRAFPSSGTNLLMADGLVLDPEKRVATRDGHELQLRKREFDILEVLLRHKGRILSREAILKHVSPRDAETYAATVTVHIKHLRDKVDRPFPTKLIQTSHGYGYGIITNPDERMFDEKPHQEDPHQQKGAHSESDAAI